MTTEQYLSKMKSLDIDRGALGSNLPASNGSIVCANKVSERIKFDPALRGKNMARPPVEDLSHLNSPLWRRRHGKTP